MRVIVFGATGGTGRATVEELVSGNHQVTAFSRHASKLDLRNDRLRTIDADVLAPQAVEQAIADQDAVVVSLGVHDNPLKVRFLGRSETPVDVCSRGTRNVIAAMKKHGLRKLVVVSAYGVGDTREKLPFVWRLVYRLLLKDQIADKEQQERELRDSGLDWVIVQPVGLTNAAPQAKVHVSEAGEVRRSTVSRRNVGRLLASIVEGDEHVHRTVAVSS